MDHNEFDKQCRKVTELKLAKTALEKEAKEIGTEVKSLTYSLHEAYEELGKAGPIGIKDLKKKLIFKQQYRAGVKDLEAYLNWLDENGFGDMAQRKTDWRALDKFCNERMENGDSLPDGVDGSFQPTIALNAL